MPPFSVLDLAPVPHGFTPADALRNTLDLAQHAERWGYTDSGRWSRAEDSWVVGKHVGWCAMSRGGRPWRGLRVI